jgi:hypothetical protein
MYALHDAGVATNVLPLPQPNTASADQLERRAVESSERASLTTDNQHQRMYTSAAAVLELVEGSAQRLAEMLAGADEGAPETGPTGVDPGGRIDVYA